MTFAGEVEKEMNETTHSKCRISALKLARAAWWMLFLVTKSSFSRASVNSVKLTFPSRLKSKAWRSEQVQENHKFYPLEADSEG